MAQLVAGITGSAGEPVIAVGSAAIDLTPVPVKDFAIQHFGSHDKMVLLAGIYVVLALFAMLTGILARRWLAYGLAGLAVFAALGVAAEATRPVSGRADAVPTLAGVAAGAIVLRLLVRAAAAQPARPAETSTSLTDPIVVASRPAGQTGGDGRRPRPPAAVNPAPVVPGPEISAPVPLTAAGSSSPRPGPPPSRSPGREPARHCCPGLT